MGLELWLLLGFIMVVIVDMVSGCGFDFGCDCGCGCGSYCGFAVFLVCGFFFWEWFPLGLWLGL